MKPLPYDKVKQLIPTISDGNNAPEVDSIEARVGSFVIRTVPHRGKNIDIEMKTDALLGYEFPLDYLGWLAYRSHGFATGEYVPVSAPTYLSIFQAMFLRKDIPAVKPLVEQWREQVATRLMMTSTQTLTTIDYAQDTKNTVEHVDSVASSFPTKEHLREVSGFLESLEDREILSNAVFEQPAQVVDEVLSWLCGKRPYVQRIQFQPHTDYLRNVSFGVDGSEYCNLWISGDVRNKGAVLGVRILEVHP